ncbi:peptidyl-tRNA hydrolase ICT1, mitochondrial isoform X2 [Gopherus flavomarginatus]|uniref:peptidyl-tRNA hydrolase ICT1, mitochondrial isoform X2 n=1 Tax=Gopherus flavomarginatus TaxID=286002 RepID=UPI0021CC2983|nr:peptidyl-tRNA hydrolase ICT1, mitochondrial isoform X2 [Gopherus flavomarginatus]
MAAAVLRGLCRARPALLPARTPRGILHRAAAGAAPSSEFRSEYALDRLYPEQNRSDAAEGTQDGTRQTSPDIPMDCLSISYCRSSGPGGQNVNKVNSKAEIRFHLASADWIAEDVRQKIAVMHKNKINKSGELIINSEVSRYQMKNLADCLEKIRNMIKEATQKSSVVSKENSQLLIARVQKMNRERLRQKKIHSTIKQSRRVDFD